MKVGPINCTADFLLRIAKAPYVATRTLIGGEPDCNERHIRDLRTDHIVQIANLDHKPWGLSDAINLDHTLMCLNAAIKPWPLDPKEFDAVMNAHPDLRGQPVYQRGEDILTVWPKPKAEPPSLLIPEATLYRLGKQMLKALEDGRNIEGLHVVVKLPEVTKGQMCEAALMGLHFITGLNIDHLERKQYVEKLTQQYEDEQNDDDDDEEDEADAD